jgi:hypothetical protein
MPDRSIGVNVDSLRSLLTYAISHAHSRCWVPALYRIAVRLGVTLA